MQGDFMIKRELLVEAPDRGERTYEGCLTAISFRFFFQQDFKCFRANHSFWNSITKGHNKVNTIICPLGHIMGNANIHLFRKKSMTFSEEVYDL